MIILCKECHIKNCEEIFELIKEAKDISGARSRISLNQEIKDLKQKLFDKSAELNILYKKISELLNDTKSEFNGNYHCDNC